MKKKQLCLKKKVAVFFSKIANNVKNNEGSAKIAFTYKKELNTIFERLGL